jgi:single-strand DNA-binding protein
MNNAITTLIGNVTRDPELRFTNSGLATAKFGLAVNFRRQNRQTNEWDETVSFFNVVCFGDVAENVSESLAKGSRVIVTGRMEVRPWETQEGEKRQSVELIADEIGASLRWATVAFMNTERRGGAEFGGGGGGGGGGGAPGNGRTNAPADSYDEEPF